MDSSASAVLDTQASAIEQFLQENAALRHELDEVQKDSRQLQWICCTTCAFVSPLKAPFCLHSNDLGVLFLLLFVLAAP